MSHRAHHDLVHVDAGRLANGIDDRSSNILRAQLGLLPAIRGDGRRVDEARLNDGHADAGAVRLTTDRLTDRRDRPLRRGVETARHRDPPRHRSHQHEMPPGLDERRFRRHW